MLKLDKYLTLDESAIESPNLCDRFSADDLQRIGNHVFEGYQRDKQSRWKWERRTQAAMDLAMQVQKVKTFPWPNCSNIAFPLVTIAALQFHSNAYPAIVQGTDVVKCRIIGEDPSGQKKARANRISTHMSWQVLEEDVSWEEQQDRLLINVPIVGTAFKKSYFDAEKNYCTSELVLAQDLVIDYWAKSVETCPRKTHVIPLFRNRVHSDIERKVFRDVREEGWYSNMPVRQADATQERVDNRQGVTPPRPDETTPFVGLEQHCDLDLDNDGYAEPYIITIEENSRAVLRIVTGFDREADIERTRDGGIISIRRMEYFTKFTFIPSPDGGIYDVGFGVLLGPLNEATNSLINLLVDAGVMSVTGGGFLGKGAKIRGGNYTFTPLEWKRMDSTGDDLRKSIVPLEVREPNAVLFQLLGLLIEYTNRIAGTTDTMVGENPGQNTPAETMRTMVAEGRKVYNSIHKRIWRAMKEEFKKRYILNGLYMPVRRSYGAGKMALREDYLGNPDDVVPAADPNVTSDGMMLVQAQALKAASMQTPGYDMEEVERRYLRALKIDGIDQVYLGVKKTGMPEDPKLQIAKLKHQGEMAWLENETRQFVMSLMEEQRMNNAQIAKIQAEIQTMQLDVQGDAEDRKVAMMQSILKTLEGRNNLILKQMDVLIKDLEVKRARAEAGSDDGGNVRRLAGPPSNGGASASAASASAGGA